MGSRYQLSYSWSYHRSNGNPQMSYPRSLNPQLSYPRCHGNPQLSSTPTDQSVSPTVHYRSHQHLQTSSLPFVHCWCLRCWRMKMTSSCGDDQVVAECQITHDSRQPALHAALLSPSARRHTSAVPYSIVWQGITSHYPRSFQRRFYWSDEPTNSVIALKDKTMISSLGQEPTPTGSAH